jgi:hypothetical protein
VVIVAVYRKAVSGDKVVAIAVVVFIFCTDIVMADGGFQTVGINNYIFVRIGAVAWVPN